MKSVKIIDKKFGVMLVLILGFLLALSPAGTRKMQDYSFADMASEVSRKSNVLSADAVASMIVDKAPGFLIVDLRSKEQYDSYHIQNAINIPFEKLLDDESMSILEADINLILYSNGNTNASMAWLTLQQLGIDSYVLQGGMNYWATAILNPEMPGDVVADEEILRYQFRKGASGYLAGNAVVSGDKETINVPKTIDLSKLKPRSKKKKGGSCFDK